jgi:hypothetical protein
MDSDNDSICSEDALNELLGIPMTSILQTAKWEDDKLLQHEAVRCNDNKQSDNSCIPDTHNRKLYDTTNHHESLRQYHQVADRAYYLTNNSIESPPVTVMDLSNENMGHILVATKTIEKGDVIFTEKSLISAQQPRGSVNIRACQMCFKSLEPGSCLSKDSIHKSIPLINLWPIQEISCDQRYFKTLQSYENLSEDISSGVVVCKQCDSLFCCKNCSLDFQREMGSCCLYTRAVNGSVKALCTLDDEDGNVADIDLVYVLSSRMFCMLVHRYRSGLSIDIFDSNCGQSEDVNRLKLGNCDKHGLYSMSVGYEVIRKAFSLTLEEQEGALSIDLYHKLSAIAQRNGIHLCTLSPFRGYYQAMLRYTGGRGSSRQKEVSRDIAKILGASDGKISKEMDRIIEDKVSNLLTNS